MTRILLFAYHDVGCECLRYLIDRGEDIAAVFSHKDDELEDVWFGSVAALAEKHGIPTFTPDRVNEPDCIERIRALRPDLVFSFYYRRLLSPEILEIPPLGAFNIHSSLLPKYRGRAPVNWAVLNGETETGVTLHWMSERPDAGDIVDQVPFPIGPRDTAQDVMEKVVPNAVRLLERQLDALKAGTAPRVAQDEGAATYFGRRTPENGRIDWSRSATEIDNLIRAVAHPYPGAFADCDGRRLYVWSARPTEGQGAPGEILSARPLRVAAGRDALELDAIQWDGGPEIAAGADHGLAVGTVLS